MQMLIGTVAAVLLQPASERIVTERPIALPFCELVRDAARHHNRVVRVEATLMFHPEGGFLYDRGCNNRDSWVWPEPDPHYVRQLGLWRNATIGKDDRARLVVVGRFQAPNGDGYGHLAGFRQQIVVRAEEDIRRSPTGDPAPNDEAPAPLFQAETQLRELDEKWFLASTKADSATLEAILSESHRRLLPSGEIEYRPQVLSAPQLPHTLTSLRPSEDARAVTFSWRVRVFLSGADSAVVIRNVERFKDRTSAARSVDATDTYEYVNLYRQAGGRWQLAFSRFR